MESATHLLKFYVSSFQYIPIKFIRYKYIMSISIEIRLKKEKKTPKSNVLKLKLMLIAFIVFNTGSLIKAKLFNKIVKCFKNVGIKIKTKKLMLFN